MHSRQRKWVQKMRDLGRCIQCGQPKGDSPYKCVCIPCALKKRAYDRRLTGFKPRVAGGRGRPCLVEGVSDG